MDVSKPGRVLREAVEKTTEKVRELVDEPIPGAPGADRRR